MLNIVKLLVLAGLVLGELDQDLNSKYLTLPKSEFIEYFNKQEYSWKIAQYENGDRKYSLGEHLDHKAFKSLPLVTHDLNAIKDLPKNFDARRKWPECETISQIYDQGDCTSGWIFGIATTASDRMCIHNKKHVNLSEQDFECLQKHVCSGGDPAEGFQFWKEQGLVTLECKPYDVLNLTYIQECKTECIDGKMNYTQDKHFAEKVYRISNDSDQIKAELLNIGPIQAAFTLYADLNKYHSGVYTHEFGILKGYHSVRVIGYGVQDNVDYWLACNSWTTEWGLHGLLKIRAYQEEIGFENYLMAGIPKN